MIRPFVARSARAEYELELAERWMQSDPRERRRWIVALSTAMILHAVVLAARLPDFGPPPTRIEAPAQVMKVQFLRPPPPPPKAKPRPPEPETKTIPRPDPTPDEPEPLVVVPPEPEPPPVPPEPVPPAISAPVAPAIGPVRVEPGQGPGLIKKVEPIYPPMAKVARIEGTVVLDAVILEDGSVDQITVLRSAHQLLNQSAIEALKQWRFSPGRQDVIMTLTVNFVLRN